MAWLDSYLFQKIRSGLPYRRLNCCWQAVFLPIQSVSEPRQGSHLWRMGLDLEICLANCGRHGLGQEHSLQPPLCQNCPVHSGVQMQWKWKFTLPVTCSWVEKKITPNVLKGRQSFQSKVNKGTWEGQAWGIQPCIVPQGNGAILWVGRAWEKSGKRLQTVCFLSSNCFAFTEIREARELGCCFGSVLLFSCFWFKSQLLCNRKLSQIVL